MWTKFRAWPLWAQIAAWAIFSPVVWTFWVFQKRLWPIWIRIGLAAAAWGFVALVATSSGSKPSALPNPEPAAAEAAASGSSSEDANAAETGTTTEESDPAPPPPPLLVARVVDGDTIDLENGDRVRLVQIDAPEAKGECYGRKAGTVLRRLLPAGQEVRVVRDRRLDNVDRYGRLLRYVFTGETNVNLALVQKGAASVWYFDGERGRYAAKLLSAAEGAKAAGRGAWGACEAELDPSGAFQTRQKQAASAPVAPVSQPAN